MKLEEVFAEFFRLEKGLLNLYFPGLNISKTGYELDFHRFADHLAIIKPDLAIKRIGINHNRETAEIRKDLDEVMVGDLYKQDYNGVIFLPRFKTWISQEAKLQNEIYCLTKLLEKCSPKSGIFAYNASEEIRYREAMERFVKRVEEATDSEVVLVNQSIDTHILIKAT